MEILSKTLYNQFKIPSDIKIPDETVYQRHGRELAVKLACNSGNQQCLDEMLIQTQLFLKGEAKIPNGLHSVVLCGGIKASTNQSDWQQLYWQMQETLDASIKSQMITSLGCTSDKSDLKSYLESSIATGASFSYTSGERRNVLNAVLNSVNGLEVAVAFLKEFEMDIMRAYGYDLEALVTVLARTAKTPQQQTFFLNYLYDLITSDYLDDLAAIRVTNIVNNNAEVQRQQPNSGHMEKIRAFLAKREGTTNAPTTVTTTPNSSPTASPQVSPTTTVQTTTAGASTLQHFKILLLSVALFISLKFIVNPFDCN